MRRIIVSLTSFVFTVSLLATLPSSPARAVQYDQPKLVSADPVDWTPNIQDGIVNAIVVAGDETVVAGSFLQAKNVGGRMYDLTNILAFNTYTGVINPNFMPTFDGEINSLATDGNGIFVGGQFTTVNGVTGYKRLVKLDPNDGSIITSFKGKVNTGAAVYDMQVNHGKLYIGGAFSSIDQQTRNRIAALDPTTGALDPGLTVSFDGRYNGGQGRIRKFDINPQGTQLVAVGNFVTVNGLDRSQIAVVDLTADAPANWETDRYKSRCYSGFDTYTNDVDYSPDGSYFVVGNTGAYGGGPNAGVMCDTVSRWDPNLTGSAIQPTWIDYTGGDTTFSVAAAGAAVYVGGHQRWWNNPWASDAAGPGAVDRMGIAALDPINGLPLSWNPVRDPRGLGVQMMVATDQGLWVGSDTSGIGSEYHGKIAFMPLDGGTPVPTEHAYGLPNDLYTLPQSGCLHADASILYRVNAGGPSVPSLDCGPDWAGDTSTAPSPYHNTGSTTTNGAGAGVALDSSVPATTPSAIFATERTDSIFPPEMQWSFPATAGHHLKVRLYFANDCGCTSQVGRRRTNIFIDGVDVAPNFDIIPAFGSRGGMKEFNVTSDGNVDIMFQHVARDPILNGVEIIDTDLPSGGGGGSLEYLAHRPFDGTTPGSDVALDTPGTDWSHARGAFVTNGKIYAGWDDGTFTERSFDGTTVGAPSVVDLHGLTSSYWNPGNVTGMFFTNGRLYYTYNGDAKLYYRYFTPEDDVVGAQTFTASGVSDGLNWSGISGMTLADGKIYYGRNSNLYSMNFDGQKPVPGTETLISGPAKGDGRTWKSRGMFVYAQGTDTFAPTKPGAPSGVSTTTDSIDLTWGASKDSVSSTLTYDVYREDNSLAGTVSSSSTGAVSFTDTNLNPGDTHTYTVVAVDDATNASVPSDTSGPIQVLPLDTSAPTVPGQPTGAATGKTKIDLTWAASTDDRAGAITYTAYRDGLAIGQVVSGSNTTVGFTDTGLDPGSTHTYTVDATDVALNPSAQSAPSDPITTPGIIFADDFGGGDLSNWVATRFSIDPANGATAAPSAFASPTAQTATLVKDLPSQYSQLCVSTSVNLTTANGTALDLLRLRTAGNGPVAKVFLSASGNLQIKNEVANLTKGSGVPLPAGAWHNVELCGTAGAPGTWDLYLDGAKIVTAWSTDTGTATIGRVTLGDNTGKTFTIAFDDVVADTIPG